ncbi:MAG: hypothetical protein MUF81_18220 [Verrucomicrobia bacterium]|jgi:hypothetical protein|nr:hypothetical protein [Verrucomicrobiota bacterium]
MNKRNSFTLTALLLAPLAALDAASSRGRGYGPKQVRPAWPGDAAPCQLT